MTSAGYNGLPAANEDWLLWHDTKRDPFQNMAVDAALLMRAQTFRSPLLRIYGWDRPAISIGCFQRHDAVREPGFTVVRRPTGGGIVYHDNDLTFTLVTPSGHWYSRIDRDACYRLVNTALIEGLKTGGLTPCLATAKIPRSVDRGAMVCFTTPTKYDVLCNDRKVAGGAQRRSAAGILYQGSIYLGNLPDMDRETTRAALEAGFTKGLGCRLRSFEQPPDLVAVADGLVASRFGTDAWNRKR